MTRYFLLVLVSAYARTLDLFCVVAVRSHLLVNVCARVATCLVGKDDAHGQSSMEAGRGRARSPLAVNSIIYDIYDAHLRSRSINLSDCFGCSWCRCADHYDGTQGFDNPGCTRVYTVCARLWCQFALELDVPESNTCACASPFFLAGAYANSLRRILPSARRSAIHSYIRLTHHFLGLGRGGCMCALGYTNLNY